MCGTGRCPRCNGEVSFPLDYFFGNRSLHFSEGRSLTDKALRIMTADMHLLGRDDLAQEVAVHRDDVALLNYYGSELILFSDHHAIV